METIIQLTLCENSRPTDNGAVVENPFSNISFPFMPTTVSFKLAATVGLINYEGVESFNMRLQMYNKNNPDHILFDSGSHIVGPFEPPHDGVNLENINLDFSLNNIAITEVGTYVVKFQFDDNVKEQEFYIGYRPDEQYQ